MTGTYFGLTNTIMKLFDPQNLDKPSYKTNIYFIVVSSINAWNDSQKHLKISLRHLSPNKIKKILSDVFIAKY